MTGLVGSAIVYWSLRDPFSRGNLFDVRYEQEIGQFVGRSELHRADYELLAGYFIEGFRTYAIPSYAGADYPGYRSENGVLSDRIEGFSRIAPLLGVLLHAGASSTFKLPSGRTIDLSKMLAGGIVAGTDPRSPDYWGDIHDYDQRIVEASDIALSLWLSKDRVWTHLTPITQRNVANWLKQVNGKRIVDNNWHLFVTTVNVVLQKLDQPFDPDRITEHLSRAMSFYRGDGWFQDGEAGPFDYYNAWGFHYQLDWLHVLEPQLQGQFIEGASSLFARQLMYFVGPRGFPVMGRSVCYRLALTAPIVFAAMQDPIQVDPRQARRALDLSWRFFLSHGAARQGRITQGYCTDDPRIVDDYSGPASCLWSLRSLIAALYIPRRAPFWSDTPVKLPSESANIDRLMRVPNFRLIGEQRSGEIRLITGKHPAPIALEPYRLIDRIRDGLNQGVHRPQNETAKYQRSEYGTLHPFCECITP